jgi:hypothetical protein
MSTVSQHLYAADTIEKKVVKVAEKKLGAKPGTVTSIRIASLGKRSAAEAEFERLSIARDRSIASAIRLRFSRSYSPGTEGLLQFAADLVRLVEENPTSYSLVGFKPLASLGAAAVEVLQNLFVEVLYQQSGSALVEVSTDVAISLMLTDVRPSLLENTSPPWECFKVKLPPGLIRENGFSIPEVLFIDTTFPEKGRVWGLLYGSYVLRWYKPEVLLSPDRKNLSNEVQSLGLLLAGFILLVDSDRSVLELELPPQKRTFGKPKKPKGGKKFRKVVKPPTPAIFFVNPAGVWGDNLKANRELFEAKLSGRAYTTPKWLRRGHWRRQACGPGLTQTKLVRVPPTWCHRHEEENVE